MMLVKIPFLELMITVRMFIFLYPILGIARKNYPKVDK